MMKDKPKYQCEIKGCNKTFFHPQNAKLHAAISWHCVMCGYSDDRELKLGEELDMCDNCKKQTVDCTFVKVNFVKKAYVAKYPDGTSSALTKKEKGKWIKYE